jgi:hypothetical protein
MASERGRARSAVGAAAVLVLIGVGLVLVSRSGSSEDTDSEPSTASHPFEVTEPPRGYVLARAGIGTVPPTFGSDMDASLEAFTLLTEDGAPDGDGAVAVSYLQQSGEHVLAAEVARRQGMRSDLAEDSGAVGFEGWTYEAGPAGADLLRYLDESGVSVRVSSSTPRSREALAAIADAVATPTGSGRPPAPDLGAGMGGLRVAGHVDAAVIAAQWPLEALGRGLYPEGAHVMLFVTPNGRQQVVARTLPGRAADLAVIGRHPWLDPRRVGDTEVDGRPAVRLTCGDRCKAVATTTGDGDLLLVSSTAHDHRALEAIAASVEPVDQQRWSRIVDDVADGPEPKAPGS